MLPNEYHPGIHKPLERELNQSEMTNHETIVFQSSVITDLFLIGIHFTIMLIIALLENQRQSILA